MKRFTVSKAPGSLLPHVVTNVVTGAPLAMFQNFGHADDFAVKLERDAPKEAAEITALRTLMRVYEAKCAESGTKPDCDEYHAVAALLEGIDTSAERATHA